VAFDTLPAASTGSDGVDVADSQARKAALREGQIWAFFATKERAEKFTAARQAEGYVRRAYEQTSQPAMRSKCAGRRRPLRHGPHRQFGRCIIAGGEGAGTRPHTSDEGTELSETKVTVIYDNPVDAGAFESAYESEQLEAARRIPGYLRFEASKVWPKEDGTPTPAYRMLDLYYPDYDAAVAAVTTPEAGAFFEAMARLSTGGVRVLVSDIEVTKG